MIMRKPNTDKKYEPKDPSLGGKEEKQLETRPTTIAEAKAQGWTESGMMKMSDPPIIGFTKDGETIWIRAPMRESQKKFFNKRQNKKNKKGGSVSKYSKGGGVRSAKYKI